LKSHGANPFILASASSRRQELLREAGFSFEIVPSQADESLLLGEGPVEYVSRLARVKALDIGGKIQDRWVLAADTVVAIEGKILGKPAHPREAEEMLRRLSGRVHEVHTGYCLLKSDTSQMRERVVTTKVKFKAPSDSEIQWYIGKEEPLDKAGAYAIQGKAAFMVEEVHGSYTNVVGLPLCEVVEDLRAIGAADPFEKT